MRLGGRASTEASALEAQFGSGAGAAMASRACAASTSSRFVSSIWGSGRNLSRFTDSHFSRVSYELQGAVLVVSSSEVLFRVCGFQSIDNYVKRVGDRFLLLVQFLMCAVKLRNGFV